jgi:tocopherol O-methyltransferase
VSAHERAVAEHYDALDPWYRALWGEHLHHGLFDGGGDTVGAATRRLVDLVAAEAALAPGARVCDVGCGYGATARVLAAEHGARVLGLTLSGAQAAVARAAGVEVLQRSWLANGLGDAGFDAVIAVESVSHMTDRPLAFAEAARVLRPGGRLVVLDWLAGPRPRALERRALLAPICREGHLAGLDTLAAYERNAAAAGLSVRRADDLTAAVAPTWPRALRRVARRALADATLRRALRDPQQVDRSFPLTMARLAVASRTGAFRYGLVVAERPEA